MAYPVERLQRNRQSPQIREFMKEIRLSPEDLIMPLFIHEGRSESVEIPSMPGCYQHSLANIVEEATHIAQLGIPAVILFGIPTHKDNEGSSASDQEGVIQQAIQMIKEQVPELLVIADCCCCEYTDHGHCGPLKDGELDHDATLARYQDIALSYAKAGADIIAPSGMMDGMVQAIRGKLDQDEFTHLPILSYSVKYASAFYGPFRQAGGAGDVFTSDRAHHQMAITQSQEAFREAQLDEDEGADMLMVKPAMSYLDIIHQLKAQQRRPILAYHVSGEYAMIKAAAAAGIVSEADAFEEQLIALKRAGAHKIITYYAKEYAQSYGSKKEQT
ncbi:MAG: porphobilinogen synthase [Actinobacteria bacterium]|nr:porphobilinogen synthase [Actinomycetota bacterium]